MTHPIDAVFIQHEIPPARTRARDLSYLSPLQRTIVGNYPLACPEWSLLARERHESRVWHAVGLAAKWAREVLTSQPVAPGDPVPDYEGETAADDRSAVMIVAGLALTEEVVGSGGPGDVGRASVLHCQPAYAVGYDAWPSVLRQLGVPGDCRSRRHPAFESIPRRHQTGGDAWSAAIGEALGWMLAGVPESSLLLLQQGLYRWAMEPCDDEDDVAVTCRIAWRSNTEHEQWKNWSPREDDIHLHAYEIVTDRVNGHVARVPAYCLPAMRHLVARHAYEEEPRSWPLYATEWWLGRRYVAQVARLVWLGVASTSAEAVDMTGFVRQQESAA